MITRRLIERIEGEASVDFTFKDERIDDVSIRFEHARGFDRLLRGKAALDALVYAPRVCGICGHSHLMAAVRALEACYADAGAAVTLTAKAKAIREITLMLELIQNHFKWFYLVIYPEIMKLGGVRHDGAMPLKGAYGASLCNSVLAVFAGQWPHSSYALPGGVTCDPTHLDLLKAQRGLDEVIRFFETQTAGMGLGEFLALKTCKAFNGNRSDIAVVEHAMITARMHEAGYSYDRFIVLGDHSYAAAGKMHGTTLRRVDAKYADVRAPYITEGFSHALNAHYKGDYYETGPLARAMIKGYPLIKNMHRRFKDSAYTRVMARLYECAKLLDTCRRDLALLELGEASFTEPKAIEGISGVGEGVVEAPRGPLIHRVELEAGLIKRYEMITPTQWNLGCDKKSGAGVAQRAMLGLKHVEEAEFVFRTFDVCSVCTTH